MTMLVALTAVVLVILVCAAVAWPLLRPLGAPGHRGRMGAERAEEEWSDAKARLVAQMRENDLALAEGRISALDHAEIGARLADEAETALGWLRQMRQSRDPSPKADDAGTAPPGEDARPRGRWLLVPAAVSAVVAVAAVFYAVGLGSDLDLRRSPHADGTVPLAGAAPGTAMPPLGADGAPDIGAMVARLEARIEDGAPAVQDLRMLVRSYATLGRSDEVMPLFESLFARFPERTDYRLAFVRAVVADPDLAPPGAVGEQIETILLAEPDNLELRWYRGLTLARLGHFGAARAELEWLRPRMAENPQAQEAIALLLARLPESNESKEESQ